MPKKVAQKKKKAKCKFSTCGYTWESRVPHPKECPRCKRRQDW